jgi:hypothetical protein
LTDVRALLTEHQGTDDAANEPRISDSSGCVKLFSGLAELNPYDTDMTVKVKPRQITWTDFTKLSDPQPIQ